MIPKSSPNSWMCIAVFSLLVSVLVVNAATIEWAGGDGDFTDPASWIGPVAPDVGDAVLFGNPTVGDVTVTIDQNADIGSGVFTIAGLNDDSVDSVLRVNLDGNLLISGSVIISAINSSLSRSLIVSGDGITPRSTVDVNEWRYSNFQAAADNSGNVSIRVDGLARLVARSNTSVFATSNNSSAYVEVVEGSLFSLQRMHLAGGTNSIATVDVSGAGSELSGTQANTFGYHWLGMGAGSSATIEVDGGGSYSNLAFTDLGRNNTGEGRLIVSGEGSSVDVALGLYVGGQRGSTTATPAPVAQGKGLLSMSDGAIGSIGERLHVLARDVPGGWFGVVELDGSVELTVANAIFDAGSVFRIGIASATQDANLIVDGALEIGGSFLEGFLTNDFIPSFGQSFAIAEYDSLSGLFANVDGLVVIDGHTFVIDYALDGENVIGLTVIPEPGTAALLFGCTILLLAILRRRVSGRRVYGD